MTVHAATLTIDLPALVANWRLLAARAAPGMRCRRQGRCLWAWHRGRCPSARKSRVPDVFLAHLSEAHPRARVRRPEADIDVLNGLPAFDPAYREHRLRPVLGSLDEIARLGTETTAAGGLLPVPAVHVDTGMNRLGLRPEVFTAASRQVVSGSIKPSLIISAFRFGVRCRMIP